VCIGWAHGCDCFGCKTQIEGDCNRVTEGLINYMHGVDKVLEVKQRPDAPPSPVPKREGM
jgi:hypothetical protein